MTNIYALEALGWSLKDILDCDAPFGGKVMILGGDFLQILLVVQKGTKAQMISECIFMSPFKAQMYFIYNKTCDYYKITILQNISCA